MASESRVTVAEASSTSRVQVKEDVYESEDITDFDGLAYCAFLRATRTFFDVNPSLSVEVLDGSRGISFKTAYKGELELVMQKSPQNPSIIKVLDQIDTSFEAFEYEINTVLIEQLKEEIMEHLSTLKANITVVDGVPKLLDEHIMNAAMYSRIIKLWYSEDMTMESMIEDDVLLTQFKRQYEEFLSKASCSPAK